MKKRLKVLWGLFLLLSLWGIYDLTNPFSKTLLKEQVSLQGLSSSQKINLELAAKALEGSILLPNTVFSFNRTVGPRTTGRGYRAAPSYLGGESPSTVGGGICLLSSLLYQVSLRGGLKIQERVPHLRTIHSVPPGLDASVWYGQADLKVLNPTTNPLRITTRITPQTLQVSLEGRNSLPPIHLRRIILHKREKQLQVVVFRQQGKIQALISRDLYGLVP